MEMEITRKFSFDAAHHLTNYRGKCEKPHGHTYRLEVTVEGEVGKNGMVMDFAELKKIVEKKVLAKLDHRDLNEIFKNPSAENICAWIWKTLQNIGRETKTKAKLEKIRLYEGENSYVEYEGD